VDKSRFVFLGGGMVAGYAAKQLVELGLRSGDLTIISADTELPYERPPLSKGFLAGKDNEDAIRISPAEFYKQHGIDVRLRTIVASVDSGSKKLRLADGSELGCDKLVIATGAGVRTFDSPGSNLKGIYYLRSMDDSRRIRERAALATRAVVVGGGFIGMEVASVLAQKGLDTTMVLRNERIWDQFFTPEMSRFFEAYYTARGVKFERKTSVESFSGDGVVQSVRLVGARALLCDIVVAGIGVQPVTEPLAGSGIELSNGVMVNEYLETNRADINAAGDVANYYDVLFGKRRRVEHWDNAVSQGQHVARILMGDRKPFVHVPYFFSDVFDLSYEFWGDTSGADQVITRGDLTTNSFSVWWLRSQQLVATFIMNRPDDERTVAPKWIESKQPVASNQLKDASHPLA
jgi:NADPH-dependent 2,4-dienoyl-CoA reductase/sulfur reductase-like enzyme